MDFFFLQLEMVPAFYEIIQHHNSVIVSKLSYMDVYN